MKTIRVGSRESALAVIQAELVIRAIRRFRPDADVELVTMKTTGDRILDRTLDKVGGKGLFVKELDDALLSGRVDICVHSYKDMPVPDNPDLPVVAVSGREDPRDVLLLPEGRDAPDMTRPLGSASQRRRVQLETLYPAWRIEPIRGNIQTRLRKMDEGQYGGIVLAAAGIRRLGLWRRVARAFETEEILPSACQGILAVQGRAGEEHPYLALVDNALSRDAAAAERAFIQALDGGCSAPMAAHAVVLDDEILLTGMHVTGGGAVVREMLSGPRGDPGELGARLAGILKEKGVKRV